MTVDPAHPLLHGVSHEAPEGGVCAALARAQREGRPARIKFGMDPTAPDLHLGHAVILQRLRAFQDAGHTVCLIVGDFTARVGDPSGRSKTRPMLTHDEIARNAATFCEQAFVFLDPTRTEVLHNSKWLDALTPQQMLGLLAGASVQQLLARQDFADRLAGQEPLSMVELVYPLLQGLDSVHVAADIEAGGHDQQLNLLSGRSVQKQMNQHPQAVVCWPILPGLDGERKMSKSFGNHVAVADDPANQFGQIMSINDELMPLWADLLAVDAPEGCSFAALDTWHPMQAKRHLARTLVTRLHPGDERAAARAEAAFDAMFRAHRAPDDVPEVAASDIARNEDGRIFIPRLLVDHLGAPSNAQGRRHLAAGDLHVDEQTWPADQLEADDDELIGRLLRLGKRRFVRIT